MSEQLRILQAEALQDEQPNGAVQKLGVRQRVLLDLLTANGPMAADEIGAELHARAGKHGADTRCQWCGRDGGQVAYSLQRRRLVRHVRATGLYQLAGETRTGSDPASARTESEPASPAYDPATSPWPDGF